MNNLRVSAPLWLVYLIVIFPVALAATLFGKAESTSRPPHAGLAAASSYTTQVTSLSPVDGATPGTTATLSAQVKNISGAPLPSDARVWFWVDDGPNWSGYHWVGSASTAALAAGADQWYSFDWTIPSSAPEGEYTYWAQVWTNIAISDWSSGQKFTVAKIPNLVGEWKGQAVGYSYEDSGNPYNSPQFAQGEVSMNITTQNGRVFAGTHYDPGEPGDKLTGVLMPDGSVSLQFLFDVTGGTDRYFINGTLANVRGRYEIKAHGHTYEDVKHCQTARMASFYFSMYKVN